MSVIGTPLGDRATRLILLGSGELGKEVAIEAIRLGCEVVAIDRYPNAPAMQVAHRSHVLDMTDPGQLRNVLEAERSLPHSSLAVLPELEAIATRELEILEADGMRIVPTARAARLTMDREGIRRLAAEELGVQTSNFRFCDTLDEVKKAVNEVDLPCVIKPVMSSSGKGQSVVKTVDEIDAAWEISQNAARVSRGRVIVEEMIDFDYEVTLLTIRHAAGTSFCTPIGHSQESGDYRESWQPHPMSDIALARAQDIAERVTEALGGHGIFGVELFVLGDDVLFSEVSPRPHDTGMVTMTTQAISEFELHVRAVLGLPVPRGEVATFGPGASTAILADRDINSPNYEGLDVALALDPRVGIRIFGKPTASAGRRMGVALARSDSTGRAREMARKAAAAIRIT